MGMHKDVVLGLFHGIGSGHMIVGVPGIVAGIAEVLRRFGSGKFTLGQLSSDGDDPTRIPYAHELAKYGVQVTFELAASFFTNTERLQYYPETQRIYAGQTWNTTLIQSDYAKSLALIAKYGPDAFYKDGCQRG